MLCSNNSALIIAGGSVDPVQARSVIDNYSHGLIIAADSGIEYLRALSVKPDVVLGDFDSVSERGIIDEYVKEGVEIIEFPPEKDYTDMRLACDLAVDRGFRHIVMLGAVGSRLDHTLLNIGLLRYLQGRGAEGVIVGKNNRVRYLTAGTYFVKKSNHYRYVSMLPLTDSLGALTLTGFKYNACRLDLSRTDIITVSNEIEADEAELQLGDGELLLIESID